MKKFNFRLNRVLDYRTLVKKESERDFAKKATHLKVLEKGLEDIVEAQERTKIQPKSKMTMAEFSLVETYQEHLQEALVNQRVLVNEAAEAVDRAREVYIEKAVEEEVLENLKARKLEDYKVELRRSERKERDELTVQRHRFPKPGAKPKGGN